MKTLSEFEQRTAAILAKSLFTGRLFNICPVRDLSNILDRQNCISKDDMECLSALHCRSWVEMGPELSMIVKQKTLAWLGLEHQKKLPPVEEVFEVRFPVEARVYLGRR